MRKVCSTCGSRRVASAFALASAVTGKLRASCKRCVGEYAAAWRLERGHVPGAIGAPSGERNGRSKLTAEDVLTIRTLYDCGDTQAQLAKDYGVTPSHMSRIISGEHWKEEDE